MGALGLTQASDLANGLFVLEVQLGAAYTAAPSAGIVAAQMFPESAMSVYPFQGCFWDGLDRFFIQLFMKFSVRFHCEVAHELPAVVVKNVGVRKVRGTGLITPTPDEDGFLIGGY